MGVGIEIQLPLILIVNFCIFEGEFYGTAQNSTSTGTLAITIGIVYCNMYLQFMNK